MDVAAHCQREIAGKDDERIADNLHGRRSQSWMESIMETSIEVATPNQKKLKALGFVWIAVAFLPLTIIAVLIYATAFSEIPILNLDFSEALIASIVGFALMLFLLWGTLANAAHRFSTSRMESRCFRVSPDGISICVSKNDAKAIYLFKHGLRQVDLMWFQIKEWHAYTKFINGIPTSKTIVFKTIHGVDFHIPTYN
jgi:hypothetical protein